MNTTRHSIKFSPLAAQIGVNRKFENKECTLNYAQTTQLDKKVEVLAK